MRKALSDKKLWRAIERFPAARFSTTSLKARGQFDGQSYSEGQGTREVDPEHEKLKEKAKEYLSFIRIARENIVQRSDQQQVLVSGAILAGLFSIYSSNSGDAFAVLFTGCAIGKWLWCSYGIFILGKVIEYYIDIKAYDDQETLYSKFIDDNLSIDEFNTAKKSYALSRNFGIFLSVVFGFSTVILLFSVFTVFGL